MASTSDAEPATAQSGTERDDHFRQLYSKPPDFKHLAELDPDFAAVYVNNEYLRGNDFNLIYRTKERELDFADPKSVMQLTKTLLKLDFDLDIDLPDNRLCPPVCTRIPSYLQYLSVPGHKSP